jgi:UDP-N-acetylglucosamine transferase subunit ALG13
VLGGSGRSLALLKLEFPTLESVYLPGYDIRYPLKGGMALNMLLSIPRILRGIKNEHALLQQIVLEKKIDGVISDNRYGLYSRDIPSVLVTHQVFIQTPAGSRTVHRITRNHLNRFSECWIPDLPGIDNLSGELSHLHPCPANYYLIGPLSRFSELISTEQDGSILFLLSGPEPMRTAFEKKIIQQTEGMNRKMILLRGTPGESTPKKRGFLEIHAHTDTLNFARIISDASVLIGRSGYSSIMDAAFLGKKCIFIPTPGQTEQEYLARYHATKGHCITQQQSSLNLIAAIEAAKSIRGFEKRKYSSALLKARIANLIGS